ncbi:hypothetical protein HY031_00390 [Candidatus Gottesmanbacteria bacterium]|nr:hypothetical protein [Candidatus Gottesmanbacteria bacterium]
MNEKHILLTGDDGYNSIGTRLLIYFLKDRYELAIAATKSQQSAVGGHMSVVRGGSWGETKVDGIPAVWSSTYPADAVEVGRNIFKRTFDLVISGINLGVNIGGGIISSGTFAAAHRAVDLRLAPVGIVMSWDTHPSLYHKEHNGDENIAEFIDYPGAVAYDILTVAQKNNFWGARLLNINFPAKKTRRVRFTKPVPSVLDFYQEMKLDRVHHTFSFPEDDLARRPVRDPSFDSGAILNGFISVSLFKMDFVLENTYKQIKSREFTL